MLKFPDPHDPRDVADYPFLWKEAEADPLKGRAADPIVSAVVRIVGESPSDLVVEDTQIVTPHVIARLSGGTAGNRYRVECEVVLTSGQRFNREAVLTVRNL